MEQKEEPILEKDQICVCDHSLERHILMGSHGSGKMVCIERFCPCSSFKLNHVKGG